MDKYALDKCAGDSIVVVGEDTDLFVIVIALTPPTSKLFFLKPGKGNTDNKLYCSQDICFNTIKFAPDNFWNLFILVLDTYLIFEYHG